MKKTWFSILLFISCFVLIVGCDEFQKKKIFIAQDEIKTVIILDNVSHFYLKEFENKNINIIIYHKERNLISSLFYESNKEKAEKDYKRLVKSFQ
jgi:hypothetical protein